VIIGLILLFLGPLELSNPKEMLAVYEGCGCQGRPTSH
jgi:hypothetical protein